MLHVQPRGKAMIMPLRFGASTNVVEKCCISEVSQVNGGTPEFIKSGEHGPPLPPDAFQLRMECAVIREPEFTSLVPHLDIGMSQSRLFDLCQLCRMNSANIVDQSLEVSARLFAFLVIVVSQLL